MAPAGKVTACTQCHVGGNYTLSISPTDCGNSGCHLTTWQQTNNPPHQSAGTPFAASNCSTCHDTIAWTDSTFNHAVTGWPLTGNHQMAPAGVITACTQCHVGNNYNFTSANTDCYGCHQADYNSTTTLGGNVPNHVQAAFPTSQCSSCHDTINWADSTFNHSTTGFPLTNSHQMAPAGKVTTCAQCHIGNNYALSIAPTDCGNSGCHLTDWNNTNNPTHSAAGSAFAVANCSNCHDNIAWTDTTGFNHAVTGWALTGAHLTGTCVSCHVNNQYNLTTANTDCYGCHTADWNSTQTLGGNVPNHVSAGFPTSQCSSCHDTTNWADSTFNHNSTGFPLTNSHQMAPAGKVTTCAQCHVGGNYNLQAMGIGPTSCDNQICHLTTWQQTNNPTHSTAGSAFASANCSTCHDTIVWTDNTFNHAVTGWPLTGAHLTGTCVSCHVGNNYNFTSANTDCYGCHTADWNSTQSLGGTIPNHVALNYPASQCSTCHDTTAWADGTFNHASTGFTLTGAHLTTACNLCHVSNNYSLTSTNTACYGCHQTDWNSTFTMGGSVPNHQAAGYPTTCDTCHTTTAWTGATFNHTWFPIPHHGSVCADCHQVSTDYTQFTCINCHTDTTAHRPGMSHPNVCSPSPSCWYQPTTCYNCHKNGGG
jgi:hypothetical protein